MLTLKRNNWYRRLKTTPQSWERLLQTSSEVYHVCWQQSCVKRRCLKSLPPPTHPHPWPACSYLDLARPLLSVLIPSPPDIRMACNRECFQFQSPPFQLPSPFLCLQSPSLTFPCLFFSFSLPHFSPLSCMLVVRVQWCTSCKYDINRHGVACQTLNINSKIYITEKKILCHRSADAGIVTCITVHRIEGICLWAHSDVSNQRISDTAKSETSWISSSSSIP